MTEEKKGKTTRKIIVAIVILAIIPALIILHNTYDALTQHQKTQINKQPTALNHQKAKRNRIAKAKKQQPQENQPPSSQDTTGPQPPASEPAKGDAANPHNTETSTGQAANIHSGENPTPRIITTASDIEATRIATETTTSKPYFTQRQSPIDRLHNAINAPDESPRKPYNPVIWFDTDNKNQGSYE